MESVPLKDLPAFVRTLLAGPRFAGVPQRTRAAIVALSGELGAGKTTFVQALARELGVKETVQSPTYVLMRSYNLKGSTSRSATPGLSKVEPWFTRLIHIDAYRLESPKEFTALKPEEFLQDPHNVVCVEWPERLAGVLPAPDVTVRFSSRGAPEGERYIEVV